jgi:hypothetical protein
MPTDSPTPRAESHAAAGRLDGRQRLLVVVALLAGLALMIAHALTKMPHVDEGDLGSAAVSILDRGHMAFPFSYYYLPSFRDDYLLPPFYFYTLAGWFALVGRTIETFRAFHVLWWLALTLCWISVVRSASRSASATVIGAVLLALNYDTINLGVSRYDIVTAALNAAAIAAYLAWRRDHFTRAIVVANACLALAAITHPHAIFGLLTCGLIFAWTGDWRRVRPRHAALALLPYAVAFGTWALLIDGRWSLFLDQMLYGTRSKRGATGDPLASLATDLRIRWWELFAGWREGVPVVMKAKTGFLVVWTAAAIVALWGRRGNGEANAIRRALSLSTLLIVVMLAFIDTLRLQIYVINVVPPAVATLAIVLGGVWDERRTLRPIAAAGVAGMALFAMAAIAFRVRANDLRTRYAPVARVLADSVGAGDVAIAPADLAYAVGFRADIRSDPAFSSLASGALPKIVVRSEEQGTLALPRRVPCPLGAAAPVDSASYADITPPQAGDEYRVYVRRPAASADSTRTIVRDCRGG